MIQPYITGFISFAILSTLGELIAFRMTGKKWGLPAGILWRLLVWGLTGILITLVFQIFNGGVTLCMADGYLPGGNNVFLLAFLTSATMNIFFAPTFMTAHKIAETCIELKCGEKKMEKLSPTTVLDNIDWHNLFSFVFIKTIPLFWIPAHTVAFLLPDEYRVIFASFLSIILGVLLSLGQKR